MPYVSRRHAMAAEPIVARRADRRRPRPPASPTITDHLNGTKLAVEEINAAGGVLGREIELFVPDVDKLSPESCRQAIAACIDKKVHAISNAFLFAPIPAMDESAKYKAPYLQGNTQRNATIAYKADPGEVQPRASRPIRPKSTTAGPIRSG